MHAKSDLLPRFSRAQRIAHWVLTVAFFVLTITGLMLVIPSLSNLAVGGASRLIHRIAAAGFLLVPLYYALFDRKGLMALIKDSFTYDNDDLRWLAAMPGYVLGRAKGMPPQGRLNAGEKLHHAAIILLFVAVSVSGLFLWFVPAGTSADLHASMLLVHNLSMVVMVLLTIGHLYFVFVYGALPVMITGKISRKFAELEYPKWVAQMDAANKPAASDRRMSV